MASLKRSLPGAVIFAVLLAAAIGIYLYRQSPAPYIDELCKRVQEMNLICPAVLAEMAVMKPGAITHLAADKPPSSTKRAVLPTAYLSSKDCLIPGQTLEEPAAVCPQGNRVSGFTVTYNLDRHMRAGAELPVPKLDGATLEAGPNFHNVRSLALSTSGGCRYFVDENVLIGLIESCAVAPKCIERILARGDQVIATSMVAEGLTYEFRDENDRALSFKGALKDSLISVEAGSGSSEKTTDSLSGDKTGGLVIGVSFVREEAMRAAKPCTKSVIETVSGTATAMISGGGGHGEIGSPRSDTQALGTTVRLAARGTESSECDPDFHRQLSSAEVTSLVDEAEVGEHRALILKSSLSVHGGGYNTCASCLLGRCVGTTAHDTTATASVNLHGSIAVLVRNDTLRRIRVTWSGLPDNTQVAMERLQTGTAPETVTVHGSGSYDFPIPGLGTYAITTTVNRAVSRGGTSGSKTAKIDARVVAEPLPAEPPSEASAPTALPTPTKSSDSTGSPGRPAAPILF
jgi:hypothetical protein